MSRAAIGDPAWQNSMLQRVPQSLKGTVLVHSCKIRITDVGCRMLDHESVLALEYENDHAFRRLEQEERELLSRCLQRPLTAVLTLLQMPRRTICHPHCLHPVKPVLHSVPANRSVEVLAIRPLSCRSPRLAKPCGMRSSPESWSVASRSFRLAARRRLVSNMSASLVVIWTTAKCPENSSTLPGKSRTTNPGHSIGLNRCKNDDRDLVKLVEAVLEGDQTLCQKVEFSGSSGRCPGAGCARRSKARRGRIRTSRLGTWCKIDGVLGRVLEIPQSTSFSAFDHLFALGPKC